MTVLMIDVDVNGAVDPCNETEDDDRGRKPVESAFEMKIVLSEFVVKMRTSIPRTRT